MLVEVVMKELYYIEYRFPFDPPQDQETKVVVFKGTEDEMYDFVRKEAYELMKTYEISSIQWQTNVGNKTIAGGIHLPKVFA